MREEDEVEPDLQPLTLRQKVENKRFNKTWDRILGGLNAVSLGILGYGGIKEAFDAIAGDDAFGALTFTASIVIGVGMQIGIAYLSHTRTKRED